MRLVEHRGKWAFRHEGRRISTGVDYSQGTRDEAERAARKKIQQLAPAAGDTIGEIMEAYALDKEREGRDGERSRASWRALEVVFDGLRPDDITRDKCRLFANYRREQGISDGTIIRDLKIMQAACRWKNPRHLGQFFYPSEPEPRDRVLTREEVRRLVDSASAYHIRLFIHLAYGTAARAGALYELQWSQVDLDAETINLGRKANGKSRAIIPMTKTLKEALQEAQEIAETDYVLEYAGRPIRSARTGFKAACKRAGIDAFRIHDLRHTAAVHQIEAGVPIEMVSQYLGHANIAITAKHYARYRPQMMGAAANALELNR